MRKPYPSQRPERPRESLSGSTQPRFRRVSRGPSGRRIVSALLPRESAFGLIPGLESPGPLGRSVIGVLSGDLSRTCLGTRRQKRFYGFWRKCGSGPSAAVRGLPIFSPPDWIRLGTFTEWRERGLFCTFGHLKGIHKSIAQTNNFKGALDAFDVAERIADSENVGKILQGLRIRDRVPRPLN